MDTIDTMQLFLEFERRSGKFDENRDGTGRPTNGRHRALCRCLKCARVVGVLASTCPRNNLIS